MQHTIRVRNKAFYITPTSENSQNKYNLLVNKRNVTQKQGRIIELRNSKAQASLA